MDRDRLKEVRQTDLTESRVNEDFLDWLKNKGPTWLLVALLAICAYLGVTRFRQGRANYRNEAWAALAGADLPGSYEDVAREFGDVGQLGNLARMRAAERLLRSVQAGLVLGATAPPANPGAAPPPVAEADLLGPEDRDQYLARADGLFDEVLATDDGTLGTTLYMVGALNGKGAIAECRHDVDGARTWYERAAERAAPYYPGLAEQSRERAASAGGIEASAVELPALPVNPTLPAGEPVRIEPALRDLIVPADDEP